MCDTFMSGREIFFCWWERQKEHSSCANAQRTRWEVGGPYFHGHAVYAMAYDSRGGQHRIWASTQSYWGTMLRSSDDFGKSWTNPHEAPIRFPADTGLSLKNIWQISLGPSDQP